MSEIIPPQSIERRRFYRPNTVDIFSGAFRAYGAGSLIGAGMGILCALLIVAVFVLMPLVNLADEIGTLLLPVSRSELSTMLPLLVPGAAYYGVIVGGTAGFLSGLMGYLMVSFFVPAVQWPRLHKVHSRGMLCGTIGGVMLCPLVAFLSASSSGKAVVPGDVVALTFQQLLGWLPASGLVVGGL